MHIIQILSAGYVLSLAIALIGAALHAGWTNQEANVNVTGYPALLAVVAVIICAVTTLVAVW